MFLIKWVEMDEIYNYYPKILFFNKYEKAREFLSCQEEILESQLDKIEDSFTGKIISEIYLEEIKLESQNV